MPRKLGASQTIVNLAEKEGQVTEAVYLGHRKVQFPDRLATILDLQGANGPFSAWAGSSIERVVGEMRPGNAYRFTYRGIQKTKAGRSVKAFDVEELSEELPI